MLGRVELARLPWRSSPPSCRRWNHYPVIPEVSSTFARPPAPGITLSRKGSLKVAHYLLALIGLGQHGEDSSGAGIDRVQYNEALRATIEELACTGAANRDRRAGEAFPARDACAPEPLGPGQACRVD